MFFELIGQFETDGNLLVTDPCYDIKEWCNTQLKIKSGLYDVYIVYGKLKNPIFDWDKHEGNYRNAQIIIIHSAYKGKFNFKKHKAHIGVDSGQAGFFNLHSYKKDASEDVPLSNQRYHFFKNNIGSKLCEISMFEEAIKNKNELFQKMCKHFGNDEEKTIKWFKDQNENNQIHIDDNQEILRTENYPSYIPLKYSKDFYEIMCDLTCSKTSSGVLEPFGAVSSSGEGDGGYSLFTAKNKNKQVISAYINFIDLKWLE